MINYLPYQYIAMFFMMIAIVLLIPAIILDLIKRKFHYTKTILVVIGIFICLAYVVPFFLTSLNLSK